MKFLLQSAVLCFLWIYIHCLLSDIQQTHRNVWSPSSSEFQISCYWMNWSSWFVRILDLKDTWFEWWNYHIYSWKGNDLIHTKHLRYREIKTSFLTAPFEIQFTTYRSYPVKLVGYSKLLLSSSLVGIVEAKTINVM